MNGILLKIGTIIGLSFLLFVINETYYAYLKRQMRKRALQNRKEIRLFEEEQQKRQWRKDYDDIYRYLPTSRLQYKTQSLEKVYKEYLKMPCEDTKNKWYKIIREEIEEGDISE